MRRLSKKESFKVATSYQFNTDQITLGPWTSYSLLNDPKHMCFVLSRYKFCAKIMEGKHSILEIGCGDGFGIPIVAQSARYVLGIDVDDRLIEGNRERYKEIKNINNFKEVDKKSRACFFPFFEIAYFILGNKKFYISPVNESPKLNFNK